MYLRVTDNVHHIVAFIERIVQNGHAYATKEGEYLGGHGSYFSCEVMALSPAVVKKKKKRLWLQVMCFSTSGPSVIVTASLVELQTLRENLVSVSESRLTEGELILLNVVKWVGFFF